MPVLVGIDEAGFGPILGPLVVSSAIFDVPEGTEGEDFWKLLSRATGKTRRGLSGKLLVTDSKKAHKKSEGLKHLERTVLSFMQCNQTAPRSTSELLDKLCPECARRLNNYPWHKKCNSYNFKTDSDDINIASNVLEKQMNNSNIKFLNMSSQLLDVGWYNKLMADVQNKSNVLFTATATLIHYARRQFPYTPVQVLVDRQGGRVRYRQVLQRMFPQVQLKILKESPTNSSYELTDSRTVTKIHFVAKADEKFMPVSLASMISKFVRELLVFNINDYFCSRCPDLKPTAGYWQDGLRFLRQLKSEKPELEYNRDMLIRCR